ncbi:hypothetical protein BGZ82_010064 [Podila clonocystis]|nr:hypothetical protein BGZ82_010064 [Podila clonocystis]
MNIGPLNLSSSPPPETSSFGRPTGIGRTHSGSTLPGFSSSIYNTRLAASIPVESRFGSATSRFTSDLVAFLNRVGDRLPESWRPYFWPGLWFGFVTLVIGLLVGFHSKIFAALESIATFIKNLGPLRWFKAQARNLINKNQSLKSVVRTVEKRGFKLLFLIRLAPYPYNVLNLALSLTHIPITTFAAATALSLLKLSLHVYIGSTLSTLTTPPPTDGENTPDPNAGSKPLRIFVLVAGIILGVIVGAYIGLLAKREIDQSESARLDRLRRRRARQRRNEAFGSLDARDGHEGSGDYVPSVDLTNQRPDSDYVGGNYLDEDEDDEHQTLFQQSANPWDRDNAYHDEDDDDVDGSPSDSEDSVLFDEDDEFDDEPDLERGAGGAGIELSQSGFGSGTYNFFDDDEDHGVDISDRRQ